MNGAAVVMSGNASLKKAIPRKSVKTMRSQVSGEEVPQSSQQMHQNFQNFSNQMQGCPPRSSISVNRSLQGGVPLLNSQGMNSHCGGGNLAERLAQKDNERSGRKSSLVNRNSRPNTTASGQGSLTRVS